MENIKKAKKEAYIVNGIIWLCIIPLVVDQNRKIHILNDNEFLLAISALCTIYFSWGLSVGIRYGFSFVRGSTLTKKDHKNFFHLNQFVVFALLVFFAILLIKQIYVMAF